MAKRKKIRRSHMKRFASDNIQIRESRIVPHHIRDITREHYRYLQEANQSDPIKDQVFKPEEPVRQHIVLVNLKSKQVFLYWNNDYTQFYFVQKVFSIILKSIVYPDRVYAMRKYNLGKITWIERKRITETPALAPSPPTPS